MIKELIGNCPDGSFHSGSRTNEIRRGKLKTVNCRRGFTLIELLIVIAIIGVLATLLMVNFVGVRERARDAQRKSDLRQIQSALELYRADQGVYPVSGPGDGNFPSACGNEFKSTDGAITYMTKVPCDALGGSYAYSSTGTTYSIIACLENANDNQRDKPNVSPCNDTTNFSYTVINP